MDDQVRVGDNHAIDAGGYGSLTVVFPGDLTFKLLDMVYVPDIAFDLISLMAGHKQGVTLRLKRITYTFFCSMGG